MRRLEGDRRPRSMRRGWGLSCSAAAANPLALLKS